MVSPSLSAVLALIACAACGRVGFDLTDDTGASAPDARNGVDGSGGGDGAADCAGAGTECSGISVTAPIGSQQLLGFDLASFASPIVPSCESLAEVAEHRVKVRAPSEPALLQIEVNAPFAMVVTVLVDDCDGQVDSCTSVGEGSDTVVEVVMSPDTDYVISAAASNCGNAELVLRSIALGSS